MRRELSPQSTLESLKKEAKRWLKALRAGVPEARARFERAFPGAPADPGLREVQYALARQHGYDGWTALKEQLESRAPTDTTRANLVESFLRNAALDWRVGGSLRISLGRTADRLLLRHPDIARDSIYTAVVCGDLDEVERLLSEQPEAASEPGGPRDWPPLLYLCSARLSHRATNDNAVAVARALLDRGADPNAFYPGGSESIHYTALTCVAGEGEEDAPPHPRREALWQLLLESGAEPYDIQTLYNTHFRGDILWYLDLTYARAIQLGRRADWDDPNWPMLDMGGYGCGAHYLLSIAVQKNSVELAEWIIAHGASPNPPAPAHPKAGKFTLVEEALRLGHSQVADVLVRHGAPPGAAVYEGVEAFAAACFGLDRMAATSMLAEHPEYLRDPVTMFAAAKRDRTDVVAFLLDLGMSIEIENEHGARALHEAAYGDALRVVSLLLERGAEVDPHERQYDGTPLGHAVHGKRHRIIELLVRASRDVFELTWVGALERLREILDAEPDLARRVRGGQTLLMWLPDDDERAMAIARLLLDTGADPSVRNQDGETAADRARARGLDEVADLLDAPLARSRLTLFERLAQDMLAGYAGDTDALERLGAYAGDSYNNAQRLERVRDRVNALRGRATEPTLADTRLVVARQFGFDGWADLARSLTQPAAGSAALPARAATPPFYRIDAEHDTLEPRPPLTDRDWDAIIGVMEERRITGIATPAMTDRALERLSRLDFVTRVRMDGARQVSDDGLQHLARMPQIVELELGGWYCPLTDCGLEVLRHLKALRRFQMCWAQQVSDAGIANLAFCDALESVNVMGTPSGDGAINALRGKRRLRSLHTGKLVTDRGIPLLQDFPVFRNPQQPDVSYDLMSFSAGANDLLLDGPFSDAGLARLAGLDGLFGLSLFRHSHAFTGPGLAALAGLSNLMFLGCQGDCCDDAAMRSIATIPKLRMLMSQGTVATDDGFAALSRSQTIEFIWGRECPNLHGRGFAALADMPGLRGLGVSCKYVDDASLAALPRFPALRQLMPMDVPDDGFRHVGACALLEDLWCMYCRDTGDVATGHIAGLKLKSYYAGKTKITDRSLDILGRMLSLEKIEFWEIAGITDAGIAALAGLPQLRKVSVSGSPNVTRAGMAVFPPTVRVEYP